MGRKPHCSGNNRLNTRFALRSGFPEFGTPFAHTETRPVKAPSSNLQSLIWEHVQTRAYYA